MDIVKATASFFFRGFLVMRFSIQLLVQLLELLVQLFQLLIRKLFNVNQAGARAFHAFEQLVKFDLNGRVLTVLRVLNQKDHQKSDDGCAGIDDELPSVRKMEDGTSRGPDADDEDRHDKRPGRSHQVRNFLSELAKRLVDSRSFFISG